MQFRRKTLMLTLALAIAGTIVWLGGCNTVEGAGEDIQDAGESIEDAAD
jgi:predicted small secreted protein